MSGIVILLIGKSGTGKSEVAKSLISNDENCFVFDLNDEYGERTKYPGQTPINLTSDVSQRRSRHINCDFYEFMSQAENRKGCVVIFEDATGFLRGRSPDVFIRIVNKRIFNKAVYVLIFHSIHLVPGDIMELSDYVVLFHTNDERYKVVRKYPRLLPYFDKLQNKPLGTNYKIKMT